MLLPDSSQRNQDAKLDLNEVRRESRGDCAAADAARRCYQSNELQAQRQAAMVTRRVTGRRRS